MFTITESGTESGTEAVVVESGVTESGIAEFAVTGRILGIVAALALSTGTALPAHSQTTPYGFGTTPSNEELGRFFSPLPDGRGLPPGSGSVEQGRLLYQSQCLACHGDKLQGGSGDRLVGGRGTLATADRSKAPVKTVESYWPYATTLFDYVKRAMPLNAPGSLGNDEVYAVTAYILAEAKVVPADTVLDAKSLAAVKMPNRDGFIADRRPEKFPPVGKSPHSTAVSPAGRN